MRIRKMVTDRSLQHVHVIPEIRRPPFQARLLRLDGSSLHRQADGNKVNWAWSRRVLQRNAILFLTSRR